MRVCLLDVDSKIPNLALMRASTYHKQHGDDVKLGYEPLFDNPDLCYASKIFDYTDEPQYMPDCETLRGGTGYDLHAKMPFDDYDRIMPDYSLYGCDYAIGRFTRGCPNRCPWCVVPKMDGKYPIRRPMLDLSVMQFVENLHPSDGVVCHKCGMAFRVAALDVDSGYLVSEDELECVPNYCPRCGEQLLATGGIIEGHEHWEVGNDR